MFVFVPFSNPAKRKKGPQRQGSRQSLATFLFEHHACQVEQVILPCIAARSFSSQKVHFEN